MSLEKQLGRHVLSRMEAASMATVAHLLEKTKDMPSEVRDVIKSEIQETKRLYAKGGILDKVMLHESKLIMK